MSSNLFSVYLSKNFFEQTINNRNIVHIVLKQNLIAKDNCNSKSMCITHLYLYAYIYKCSETICLSDLPIFVSPHPKSL